MSTPRIYVASLSDYSAGILHGRWIDLDGLDADEVQEQVDAMLAESPTAATEGLAAAEEWAIHDYEGFEGIQLGEWERFETVVALAALLDEYEGAFSAWWDYGLGRGVDLDSLREAFEEQYAGTARTLEDWAEGYAEDVDLLAEMPEHLRPYFDWELWARDLRLGGDIWTAPGGDGVLVFWNR